MDKLEQNIKDIINKINKGGFEKADLPLILNYLDFISSNQDSKPSEDIFNLEELVTKIENQNIQSNEINLYLLGVVKATTTIYISFKRKESEIQSIKNLISEMNSNELIELMDIVTFIHNNKGSSVYTISQNVDISDLIILQLINKYSNYFYSKRLDGILGFHLSEQGRYLYEYFNTLNEAYRLLKKKSSF